VSHHPDDDPVTGFGVGKLETRGCGGCVSGKQGAAREVAGAIQGANRGRTRISAGNSKVEAIKTCFSQKFDKKVIELQFVGENVTQIARN
jgi:hypothetical protein